jgi:hypothetical protein
MTERRPRRYSFRVERDYAFDRLLALKLEQVYELMVPTRQRLIGEMRENVDETGNNLRKSDIDSTTRHTHDRASEGGVARARKKK